MPLSREVRHLKSKWTTNSGWPKRLEWLEINGLRGWSDQRVDFSFPVVAIVGENGSGKSTVLQAAASAYQAVQGGKDLYASDFFPDTPFEQISGATIRFSYREGNNSQVRTVRKPSDRWRGNPERPIRSLQYIDLSRIQPLTARVGYSKLLKAGVAEHQHSAFDNDRLSRFTTIMGRAYSSAGISLTDADTKRDIPVLSKSGVRYSGFHQGAGEIAAAELLAKDYPRNSLVLIDEIETSLHPRAQRRLIRDLAAIAREREIQIILTTHSPYVLAELPPEGRIYIMEGAAGKMVVTGVSPEFAMSRMDEEQHPECDVYVEDRRAEALVAEMLYTADRDLRSRVQIIPFGSAQVGMALGQMIVGQRFPRPSVVFLDGDQTAKPGCNILPGSDVPERVVFNALKMVGWSNVYTRISREPSLTIDALEQAMTLDNHHDWVTHAANQLMVGGDMLWTALCSEWVILAENSVHNVEVAQKIRDALIAVGR